MNTLRLALVQQDTIWQNPSANLMKAEVFAARAAERGARVLAFPELFGTGFTMASREHAEPVPGPSSAALAVLARRHGMYIIGTAIQADEPRPRNCAFALDPDGEILALYQKIHPFSYGREGEHYAAGERMPFFEIDGVKAAMQICYDLRFPEPFRAAAAQGVQLVFVPASWPTRRVAHWSALLTARAIESQLVVAGINRVGSDPDHQYPGASAVIDATGEVLVQGGATEELLLAEVDLSAAASWRAQFPALRDRRPEVYAQITATAASDRPVAG